MKCNRHNLSFWAIFCPFNPLATRKIKILKNWKKTPEDIIIFHMCTINYNHMMYGSWDIERDRQNFFVTLDKFLPIYPLKTRKIKVLKTWKKRLEVLSFYTNKCTKNQDHMLYCSWDMARDECNCYFSFLTIFCPFTHLTAPKMKISKKWKNTWRYHHFTPVYQKSLSYTILFLRYGAWRM